MIGKSFKPEIGLKPYYEPEIGLKPY